MSVVNTDQQLPGLREFGGDSGKQGGVCVEECVLSLQILFDFFILM